MKKRLGIIVWPAHIIYEGINSVLDNLERIGVTDVCTVAQVVEPNFNGTSGRREPPDDGRYGGARTIDRPVWGKKELYLSVEPSYEYNPDFYKDQLYKPAKGGRLTREKGHIIFDFLAEAKKRGMGTYIQIQVCHIPAVDPNNSSAPDLNESTPLLPFGIPAKNRIYNFASIASDNVRAYACSSIKDIATAYPMIDGFLLDRAEQSFYTLDDVFLDFGSAAKEKAEKYGFPFEEMKQTALEVYDDIRNMNGDVFASIKTPQDMSDFCIQLLRKRPMLNQIFVFRAKLVESYLKELREAADQVNPNLKLIPTVFPPPMNIFTGVDFSIMNKYVNAVQLKIFTMHWSMIVTAWAEQFMNMNPRIKEEDAVRFVSLLMDFEDQTHSSLKYYVYPEADQAHIAGTQALIRKFREAEREISGRIPIYSLTHGYGPIDDLKRRFEICWNNSRDGMWINRYGYLKDEKLKLISEIIKNC